MFSTVNGRLLVHDDICSKLLAYIILCKKEAKKYIARRSCNDFGCIFKVCFENNHDTLFKGIIIIEESLTRFMKALLAVVLITCFTVIKEHSANDLGRLD